ncbi:LysR substrate-binding domain-containing protein [Legionella micdadei]|uniref:Hydrogen peroxide-inducible genes activator n=1 Tax=Legionella micdadei TaxID=451 RepID=A0A098GFM7_LEGMI|nr:LysR substrate-binding domain-containing protein [Legionella micdadei]ARG98073.1 DNA-binding transcriptional regulator OxyR [Legionella micdadei]ARH00868.1 DNA-binding transcriptional regulator OxyR [Legionella micdadei]KTD30096.1 transcriptional regulator [Legionella micdadei]NSL18529.1 LysR family transcriptional regulator [Legionella micdadei]CEG60291.1 Hydrogen peroxide-inducible genes activator [Legionella micdadei]
MNLRDLHYFVVLAEVMHFGEAAKRCHVSQPTLSMQIKKLEEELGVALFERNNKQVMLTDQGKALVSRVQEILAQVTELKEFARAAADPFAGELRLGVIPTLAPYLLPHVMPEIQRSFPKLRVWLVEDKTYRLIEKLTAGQLDAAIMATPIEEDFSSQFLFEEPFYFAAALNSPTKNKTTMQINDLIDQPVMLLEEGHCLREQAMAVCRLAKAEIRADFTATSLETLRLMVESGIGVTLLPALSVQKTGTDNLQVIPFVKPAPSRTIALYWRSCTAKLTCLKAIAQLISGVIQPLL